MFIFFFSPNFCWPWNEFFSHHQKNPQWHLYSPHTKGVTALTDKSVSENKFQCGPISEWEWLWILFYTSFGVNKSINRHHGEAKKRPGFRPVFLFRFFADDTQKGKQQQRNTSLFTHTFADPVRQKYLHVQADSEMSDTRIGKSLMHFFFFFRIYFHCIYFRQTLASVRRLIWIEMCCISDQWGASHFYLFIYFVICRFNDKVRHIKILTKDGCFYIAESRLFKTVLVRYFYTCCSEHLDVILYSNRTNACKCGNFGCTIFIGPSLCCFCDTLSNWISYLNPS